VTANELDTDAIRSRRQVMMATADMAAILAGKAAIRPKLVHQMTMAAARSANDVPALLDAVDGLRAEVERLTREADLAIQQATNWSEDAAVLERQRDSERARADAAEAEVKRLTASRDHWRSQTHELLGGTIAAWHVKHCGAAEGATRMKAERDSERARADDLVAAVNAFIDADAEHIVAAAARLRALVDHDQGPA
jgi:hypothetical protein